ncbi:MAG: carbohydrate ABC transporter permease [Lachnospirales bacterium]
MREYTFKDKIYMSAIYFIIVLTVIICLYPFLNVVAYSLSGSSAILRGEVTFYPIDIQFQSFKEILSKDTIWRSMYITIVVTLGGTAVGLVLTTLASYALSKDYLKGRKVFLWIILFTMYFGGGIIPTFLVVKELNMLDTLWSLFIPTAMNVFNFIVMRTFFMQLPTSLLEASKLDGCGELRILFYIVLPLSLPILATIGLFYAVDYWNNYFNALMYITEPSKYTLQLQLRQLIFTEELSNINSSVTGASGEVLQGNQVLSESLKSASIIVATVPIILVYPWLQRYFVKGVMLGSVKG